MKKVLFIVVALLIVGVVALLNSESFKSSFHGSFEKSYIENFVKSCSEQGKVDPKSCECLLEGLLKAKVLTISLADATKTEEVKAYLATPEGQELAASCRQ